jgi:hypothetical protein
MQKSKLERRHAIRALNQDSAALNGYATLLKINMAGGR